MRVTTNTQTDQAPGQVRHVRQPWRHRGPCARHARILPAPIRVAFAGCPDRGLPARPIRQLQPAPLRSLAPARQIIDESLKGFDDRYHLYAWSLPAPFVLLTPQGLYSVRHARPDGQGQRATGRSGEVRVQHQPGADDVQPGRDGQSVAGRAGKRHQVDGVDPQQAAGDARSSAQPAIVFTRSPRPTCRSTTLSCRCSMRRASRSGSAAAGKPEYPQERRLSRARSPARRSRGQPVGEKEVIRNHGFEGGRRVRRTGRLRRPSSDRLMRGRMSSTLYLAPTTESVLAHIVESTCAVSPRAPACSADLPVAFGRRDPPASPQPWRRHRGALPPVLQLERRGLV